jgi:crotonobetainyl-CoA:carnitine CoA-transferase CaiB-like acyl-CoA transferase
MVALGEPMFVRFMKMVGREDLIGDPRFANDELRAENGEELSRIVTEWALQYSNAEVLGILEKNRIPAGPLLSPQETLQDAHVRGQMLTMVDVGLSRPAPYVKPPVTFSRTPSRIVKGPPRPGQDNEEVFAEVGLDAQEIAKLRQEGVI